MGVLDKINALSTGAKVGIASGAALIAAAGVGLGVTQPWNQQNQLPVNDPPPVQQAAPQETVKQDKRPLSVRAGNDVVDCGLYEGDGWSIYVPEGWSAMDASENNAGFTSGHGARFVVSFPTDRNDAPGFVCLSDEGEEYALQFYQGGGEALSHIIGYGPEDSWDYCGKLFTALARTLNMGDQSPFGEVYIIPQPADWQKAEGLTVLFLDKDGYIVDDKMQEAVENYMRSWTDEERIYYTGQYRINDIQWAACYTGITDGYIDVFRADVQYRVAEGGEAPLTEQDGGVSVADGWASRNLESVFLAVFHDGGSVEKTQSVVTADVQDWVTFAAMLE